jgi:hypothetical protein
VIQGGNGPCFTLEPGAELRIFQAIRCQLERNDAVQARIAGFVHFAHATRTREFEDLVRPQPRTRRKGHDGEDRQAACQRPTILSSR